MQWWNTEESSVLTEVNSSVQGLDDTEVEKRVSVYGLNVLPEPEEDGFLKQLIEAFTDPLAIVLTAAAVISAVVGLLQGEADKLQQSVLIMGIVIFMVLVGYYTDQQAGNELKKLKELQKAFATVMRNGKLITIEAARLVLGDIIFLKEGDRVPADARVLTAERAEVGEALLTGESVPVTKTSAVVKADAALAERTNMLFTGTEVLAGSLTAVVVGTGLDTEIGKIWDKLSSAEEGETPLQNQLSKLGKFLLYGTLVVCIAVIAIYILRGSNILDSLIVAVSLAIAFIPEALGAVITIALALGVRDMVKKGAIIKRLRAAEALGSVSVICTDKTGTVTEGQMKATHLWTAGGGTRQINGDNAFFANPEISRLVTIAHLCNNLQNPTEKALADLAALAGLELTADSRLNRVIEIPFSSARKLMSTANRTDTKSLRIHSKGAPDRLVNLCSTVLHNGQGVVPMTTQISDAIHAAVREFEEQGHRVLAFADRTLEEVQDHEVGEAHENEFTFVGLIALSDPPRPEVAGTVELMHQAGITVKMITGDSPRTALAIAKEVGIAPHRATLSNVMLGSDIDTLIEAAPNPAQLEAGQLARVVNTTVFARTSPAHKIWLVNAHQQAGALIGMAGDGVNDAPSIKQANVGIAMQGGTDITKETADVVLTGTYGAIAAAIEVGRTILQRTRLYSHALLSTNGAEVLFFIVAALLGWVAPFTAIQLLLINLLGDSWLSIALATEKPEADTMRQKPRDPNESIITKYMYTSIALQSVVTTIIMAIGWVIAGNYAQQAGLSAKEMVVLQQSTIFSIFMVQKILRSAFTARSLKYNLWQIGVFSNKWTIIAAIVTAVMTLGALYIPIFEMTPLPSALFSLLALGLIPPAVEELVKLVRQLQARSTTKRK